MRRIHRAVVGAALILVLILPSVARAGGDSWLVTIGSVSRRGLVNGTIRIMSADGKPLLGSCEFLLVDVDYQWLRWSFKRASPVSYAGHRSALEYLAQANKDDTALPFGVLGGNLVPDTKQPCHLISGGLALQKDESGRTHVLSFHDWD